MFRKVVIASLVIMLAGCGGGGGSDTTPKPSAQSTSLASVKSLYMGTATQGTQLSAGLSGIDSTGVAWTGNYTIISDGPTVFDSQNVTKSRSITTITKAGTTSVTSTSNSYYLPNGNLYKSISSDGTVLQPTSQAVLPDTAKPGDFGTFYTSSASDGTSATTTWRFESENNGAGRLVFSATVKAGETVLNVQEQTFYLNAAGIIYRTNILLTANGITLNLSGDVQ